MKNRRIPRSIDRPPVNPETIGFIFVCALLLIVLLYFHYFPANPTDPATLPEATLPSGVYDIDDLMKERERARAYQQLRNYIDQHARGPGVTGVYCRQSAHEVSGWAMLFTGSVDLMYQDGRVEGRRYRARLIRTAAGGWTVASFEFTGAPDQQRD